MAPPDVALWPDVVMAVKVFATMGKQWRAGAGGLMGLDYTPLPFVLRMARVPRAEWPDVFEDLRVLEDAALKEIYGE